jgi:hypothetical protein
MYVVKDKNGNTVAYCSQHQDALAIASSAIIDKQKYSVERM